MEKKQSMLVCAPDPAEMNGVPDEIRILPLGTVHTVRGAFVVDDESCRAILEQFKARKLDLVIDYEHQTLKDVQAPAGGWVKELYKGTDALMAKVEWTPRAKEYLQNREYRYLSPVVMVRKSDRKAVGLHSLALTNTPAIDGMFAIVNSAGFMDPDGEIEDSKGGESMEFLQKLAAALGLPETATEDDVKNAVEALLKKTQEEKPEGKPEEETVANSTILSMLGLPSDARTEDVAGKIQQLANGSSLAAEVQALKQQLAKRKADEAVEVALKAGKISAAQKEWAGQYALKDPEGFKSFCEKAAPAVPMGRIGLGEPGEKGGAQMDSMVLKNLGLTREDLEKYGNREE